MDNSRLTEIETRLAYAEHSVSELSDLVYAQSQTIDRLSEQCRQLRERVTALGEPGERLTPKDEVPPHY